MTTPKIPCPFCGHYLSRVVEGDPSTVGTFVRYRRCLNCSRRYPTEERLKIYAPPTSRDSTQA